MASFPPGGGQGGGGGGGGSTLITSVTLGSPGTIGFSSIPGTYTDLIISCVVRGTSAAGHDELHMQVNGDATDANYIFTSNFNNAATPSSQSSTGSQVAQAIPDSTATAAHFGTVEIVLPGYSSTTWQKIGRSSWNEADTTVGRSGFNGWQWTNTAVVTSILLYGLNVAALATGSVAYLYGRK